MEQNDDMLQQLILDGMVEFAGIDEKTGEMLYAFTKKAIEEYPGFIQTSIEEHIRDIYSLWELGFLDMNIAEENPLVRITKKALDQEQVYSLPTELRLTLQQIIEASRDNGEF